MPRRVLVVCLTFSLFGSVAAAVDEVPVELERLSDRVLIVMCGKVYTDQVIAIAAQKGTVVIDTGMETTAIITASMTA